MCGSTVPNIDLLQSGQFNVIPWGDTPNILALVLPVEYWNTGHLAKVLEDILQYQHAPEEIGGGPWRRGSWVSGRLLRLWAGLCSASCGGWGTPGGSQACQCSPHLLTCHCLGPRYHLHHLSHSHQHTNQIWPHIRENNQDNIFIVFSLQIHTKFICVALGSQRS